MRAEDDGCACSEPSSRVTNIEPQIQSHTHTHTQTQKIKRDEETHDVHPSYLDPFISFRRFADEQMGFLLGALIGVPVGVHVAKAHREKWERYRDEMEGRSGDGAGAGEEEGCRRRRCGRDRERRSRRSGRDRDEKGGEEEGFEARVQRKMVVDEGDGKPKVWNQSWSWPPPQQQQQARSEGENEKEMGSLQKEFENGWKEFEKLFERNPLAQASTEEQHSGAFFGWPFFSGMKDEEALREVEKATGTSFPPFDLFSHTHYDGSSHDAKPSTTWLLRSPLSPLQLEALKSFRSLQSKDTANWRDAYEDLHRVRNGQPMLPEKEIGQRRDMDGKEWIRGMLGRVGDTIAISPQQAHRQPQPAPLPQHHHTTHPHPVHDENDDEDESWDSETAHSPSTELDMYDRLLQSHSSPQAPPTSILSTLTTTERTVAQDGSVVTKVTLKKKFADGREENSESVHRELGSPQPGVHQQLHAAPEKSAVMQSVKKAQGDNAKGGWFWKS